MLDTALGEARALLNLDPKAPRRSVVKRLREERNALHPDKTGGRFPSAAREKRYHACDALLSQLQSMAETRAVTVPKYSNALVKANTEMVRSMVEESRLSRERQAQVDVKRDVESARLRLEASSSQPYHRAKFGLIGAGVLSGAIVALQDPVRSLGQFAGLDIGGLNLGFAALSVIAIVTGYVSHLAEQSEKERSRQMLTGSGIRALLSFMNKDHALYSEEVRLEDFTRAISRFIQSADESSSEEAAKAIVGQLVQQGLLASTERKSVSPTYLTSDELRDEAFRGEHDLSAMRPRHRAISILMRTMFKVVGG
ncbi:hypothetical protein [Brevundimonas subvibrioides]|uniref:Uncharacterized protein n=1 Tax=Brevundimonas subvibrioides (strain ATCC 15264 / DSM 4735 / LMG 14903 / NBRC 16000 / CB 81) TaxID=633149 RepID=D9QFK1_BRESC|nr:hypothetical protein [Brevundimonas subvibrioides]ADL02516.1 hypothetical protein Bresu_3210 [Brevundimonas subvibrioides ATCC 15264]